jgi:hypothetical protein
MNELETAVSELNALLGCMESGYYQMGGPDILMLTHKFKEQDGTYTQTHKIQVQGTDEILIDWIASKLDAIKPEPVAPVKVPRKK